MKFLALFIPHRWKLIFSFFIACVMYVVFPPLIPLLFPQCDLMVNMGGLPCFGNGLCPAQNQPSIPTSTFFDQICFPFLYSPMASYLITKALPFLLTYVIVSFFNPTASEIKLKNFLGFTKRKLITLFAIIALMIVIPFVTGTYIGFYRQPTYNGGSIYYDGIKVIFPQGYDLISVGTFIIVGSLLLYLPVCIVFVLFRFIKAH